MSAKTLKDEKYNNVIPVFHLKPKSSNRVQCNLSQYVKSEDNIFDDELTIETANKNKNTLLVTIMNKYAIVAKFCACNISGDYLLKNTKIPIYYLTILYEKQFVSGCLFNIFLFFNIDNETKETLTEPKKYFKAFMNGYFSVKIVPTDDDYSKNMKELIENKVMGKYANEFVEDYDDCDGCDSDNSNSELLKKVEGEINLEMEKYLSLLSERNFEEDIFPSQKKVFDEFKKITEKDLFTHLIAMGLTIRENARVKEKCPDISYEIPKNVINFKKICENPGNIKELLLQKN